MSSPTPDATPEPQEATPPPGLPPSPSTARRSVGDRLRAHPVLAGAAAVVIASGGAFGVGYAVGHSTGDDWPPDIRARDLRDLREMPQVPGRGELPRLGERAVPDGGGPARDRDRDRDRDVEEDESGSTDSD